MNQQTTETGRQSRGDVWVRRGCALVVAAVAAYSSYAHQRHFALVGGADQISAALWPLSVDGLVVLASLGLVRAQSSTTTRARLALWVAFLLGVAVSLAANIAAAPTLSWQPVLVAGGRRWHCCSRWNSSCTLATKTRPTSPRRGSRPHRPPNPNPRPARSARSRVPRPHPRLRRLPRPIGEPLARLPPGDPDAKARRCRRRSGRCSTWSAA